MSEDVKPRKFNFSLVREPEGFSVIWDMAKCDFVPIENYKNISVIELEPTMRLMDEMYDVINSIENCYGDAMYGHGLTDALKKYKKFKDGLK